MLRSVLAVILGYLVTAVLIVSAFVAWALAAGATGDPEARPGTAFLVGVSLWGALASALGTLVAIRVGRHNPWGHAAALLVLSWLLGYVSVIFGDGREPLLFQAMHFAMLLVGVLAGTLLATRRRGRAQDSASA